MNRNALHDHPLQSPGQNYELELRKSYRKLADTAPRPAIADALAFAFRSSGPGFPLLCAGLFEHCNCDQRAKLLTILIPALSRAAKQELATARLAEGLTELEQVCPERTGRISYNEIRLIAAEAARSDPSVIERVSTFYSRLPNITKYLPIPTIAAVLAYVIRIPKKEPAREPHSRRSQPDTVRSSRA
jgi:hypothetical protein